MEMLGSGMQIILEKEGTVPTWPTLINEFSRYYSTQGRGIKNLHDSWRKMTFEPETDDIEIFIRDAQECAKQLNYDDSVLMNMLKAAMPKVVYGTLYHMETLGDVIKFVKDYYSKSPSERMQSQQATKTEASPFKSMKSPQPIDLNSNPCPTHRKPQQNGFHPKALQAHPNIPLEEVEAGVEVEDPREENFKQETTLTIPKTEEEEEEVLEANPEEQNLTRAPLKESPGKTPKQKIQTRTDAGTVERCGHWVKDCPQKQKEMAKKDTEGAFSGLNEIAQDFYADRTTDVFHGITEDYVESGEEEIPEDNGMEPQNQIDHLN